MLSGETSWAWQWQWTRSAKAAKGQASPATPSARELDLFHTPAQSPLAPSAPEATQPRPPCALSPPLLDLPSPPASLSSSTSSTSCSSSSTSASTSDALATPPRSEHDETEDAHPNPLARPSTAPSASASSPLPPPQPASGPFFTNPRSFSSSRSIKSELPRQTVLKALASRRPSLDAMTLLGNGGLEAGVHQNGVLAPSPLPATDNNNGGAFVSSAATKSLLNGVGAGAALQSPCFYHQRFDTAVNVGRVLEEIADDEYTSHSRLMQTALGVREVARQLQRHTLKSNVKSIMIVTKARDNTLVTLTREVAQWLLRTPRYGNRLGVNVYVDKKLKGSKRFDAAGLVEQEPEFRNMLRYWTPDLCWSEPEKFDLVLTLGGDGTVLYTSWLFQRVVPPILSFSLGSLGFLTNFKFDLYREILENVLSNGMRVNMRMRFTCTVYRAENGESVEKEQFEVLNELVIDRGPSPYVSNLELYGDDELLTVVQADGCIFSTPTGSTAYSLSAGGSLVHPDIPAILLTPICAHTLNFRPMLLNDSMLLRVSIPASSRATAWCSFDGKGRIELRRGDAVTIAASQYPFPTVLSANNEWIDSISRTLRWNTRGAQQKAWGGAVANGSAGSADGNGPDAVGMGMDEDEEQEWDIDTDSGCYNSDSEGNGTFGEGLSPVGRKMALLGL